MYYNMNLPQLLLWFRGFYKRQLEGPYPLLTYKVVNKVILWRRGHTLLRFLVEHFKQLAATHASKFGEKRVMKFKLILSLIP